jgi:osmotically-inducible protein OsmY
MFLSTLHDTNAFSFGAGGNLTARCAAIEEELHYLPNFSGTNIVVTVEGGCVVLSGTVETRQDLYRAINVASDIAGAGNVIFRVQHEPLLAS